MRGFWRAALLVPALVSAEWAQNDLLNQIVTSTDIDVAIQPLSESPDIPGFLSFRVEVLASEQICGYGNITINDQELSQESVGSSSIGKGSIIIDGPTVTGSWAFTCLTASNGPYAQRLDFTILSVNGTALEEVTFWVEFKQNEDRRIYSTSATEDNLGSGAPIYYDSFNFDTYDIESELADLKWMQDVVEEFEYLIFLKEEAMATYLSEGSLDNCDSLKCILKTAYSKARVTVHKMFGKVYSKFSSDAESEEDTRWPWEKPHWRRPHWRKRPHPPPTHGNHTHGNHTCPGKGNHTHPHFPHRRPHPPPFCRCPPPPHRGHRPPQGSPPYDPTNKPLRDSLSAESALLSNRPSGPDDLSSWLIQTPPFQDPELDGTQMTEISESDELQFDGPSFDGMGSLSEFDTPTFGRKLHKIRIAVKFFIIATLFLLFIAFIYRCCRCCSSSRRKERKARRKERRRRRALRLVAHLNDWKAWIAPHINRYIQRYTAHGGLDDEDEEKRAALAGRSVEGQEDVIAAEITEFNQAFSIVSDMVAAEEGRAQGRVSTDSRSSLPDYVSELGGEPLPTYEDEERTEMSSMVADGFRYTPGSTVYTPGSSSAGSVRDIIGDTKD